MFRLAWLSTSTLFLLAINGAATRLAAAEEDKRPSSWMERVLNAPTMSSTQRDELSPEMLQLRDKLHECLAYYFEQREDVSRRSPWGIMHALIAFGVDTDVMVNGQRINAIGWLCWNGAGRGQRLLYVRDGELRLHRGPGVQGHDGQFLAMLAQSRVKKDYGIKVGDDEFTVADLIEREKVTCQAGTELTFKLIALSHYLEPNATWTNEDGEEWSVERLIKEELKQPVVTAACGGTHRMMGFSYAVRKRNKRGGEFTGQWKRAKKFVEDFHEYAFTLQNENGSFSTNWFNQRGDSGDTTRYLQTTGHILEWLVYSLPQEQLRDPRVIKSVNFLVDLMLDNRDRRWDVGPKGHALHALVLYDQRVFGAKPGQGGPRVARQEEAASETQSEP